MILFNFSGPEKVTQKVVQIFHKTAALGISVPIEPTSNTRVHEFQCELSTTVIILDTNA